MVRANRVRITLMYIPKGTYFNCFGSSGHEVFQLLDFCNAD